MIPIAGPGGGPPPFQTRMSIPPNASQRLLHEGVEIARVRDVTAYGERADAVRLALEHLAAPREHGHVCAFAGERFRRRQPKAGGCAADDRGAAP